MSGHSGDGHGWGGARSWGQGGSGGGDRRPPRGDNGGGWPPQAAAGHYGPNDRPTDRYDRHGPGGDDRGWWGGGRSWGTEHYGSNDRYDRHGPAGGYDYGDRNRGKRNNDYDYYHGRRPYKRQNNRDRDCSNGSSHDIDPRQLQQQMAKKQMDQRSPFSNGGTSAMKAEEGMGVARGASSAPAATTSCGHMAKKEEDMNWTLMHLQQPQQQQMAKKKEEHMELERTSLSSSAVKVETPRPFEELTKEEKFQVLARYPENHVWSGLPEESLVEDSEEWNNSKRKAAEVAIEEVMKRMKRNAEAKIQAMDDDNEASDEDDSYDGFYGNPDKSRIPEDHYPFPRRDIEKFFNAVPHCLFLTVGFDVIGTHIGDINTCLCPCGADMERWQEMFGVASMVTPPVDNPAKFGPCKGKKCPLGIMNHIRDLAKFCILHYGLQMYLEYLYNKEMRFGRIGHKAMYKLNDQNWQRADAQEKRDVQQEMSRVKMQLREERDLRLKAEFEQEEQRKNMELLKKVNQDQFKKMEALQNCRKTLHITQKEKVEVSSDMMTVYRSLFLAFFGSTKKERESMRLPASCMTRWLGQRHKKDEPLEIAVEQRVDLQKLFDRWYDGFMRKGANPNDATVLFCDLDLKSVKYDIKGISNYYGYKIVLDWNVKFKNEIQYKDRELKEADTAVDEGGPTREFLSQCWRQMGDLSLKDGETKIPLFESAPEGVLPMTDDWLRHAIKTAVKKQTELSADDSKYVELLNRAKAYYRAIGRIMLHSLSTDHPISSAAMPSLLQNYLLRGCSPGDKDYHRDDILRHLEGIGVVSKLEDLLDSDEDLTEDTVFTQFIPEQFIKTRIGALNAISEGLTLGGNYGLTDVFRTMPLEAVQKLVFSTPHVTAQTIIDILEPRYCVNCSTSDITDQQTIQEEFFKGTLQDVLRDREKGASGEKFLSLFVAFCTGLNYLPDPAGRPDYKIIVEFDSAESATGDFPRAHTCVNTLSLPGQLYTNRDEFEQKLDEALHSSEGSFQMQ